MTTQRRVKRVRLTAPREELVRRGALLLEDALRTASLPDDGRVLVVRSLAIGTLPTGSGASIAQIIEQKLGDLATRAVHALDPSAATSEVVFFRDAAESIAALAVRLASQQTTSAWFWPLAVPAWRPGMPRDEALRALLFASLETETGAVGGAELVRTLHTVGSLDPLLAALRPSEGHRLLGSLGWSARGAGESAADESAAIGDVPRLSSARAATLARWATSWGIGDTRSTWLACSLLVAERSVRASDPDLPQSAQVLIRRIAGPAAGARASQAPAPAQSFVRGGWHDVGGREIAAPRPLVESAAQRSGEREDAVENVNVPHDESRPSAVADHDAVLTRVAHASGEPATVLEPAPARTTETSPAAARSTPPATPAGTGQVVAASASALLRASAIERTREQSIAAPRSAASRIAASPPPPRVDHAQRTAFGGLFFLLPVLHRLALPAHLSEHPDLLEWELPRRVLRDAANRAGAGDDDPVLLAILFSDEEGGEEENPGSERAQHRTRRRLVVRWTAAARHWCRAHADLSLRAVIRRPARVAATRTHIDVYFDLAQIDLRIRRAGLDVDPGWVPWFGRVVKFHYQSEPAGHGN